MLQNSWTILEYTANASCVLKFSKAGRRCMSLKTLDILKILIELLVNDFNSTKIAAYDRYFVRAT